MNAEAFRDWLVEDGRGATTHVRLFPEAGVCTYVHRLLYHWTLRLCVIGDTIGYADAFCYRTQADAVAALERWDAALGGEPEGWDRNPPTGRRRPGGDAAKEYVTW